MTLATPSSIQKLQMALHAKAKDEPEYRFYLLYDKVYRGDILQQAYACCKANKGAAGVDDERFEDIEAYGVECWLGELAEDLRKKTYRPQAVRRVYLKKPNGKLRPIGIPPIRDRVVQTAAVLVLTPIFEADLPAEQHGYRPERNALTAVREVHSLLNTGHTRVVEADAELMTSVARRVVDGQMLHLINRDYRDVMLLGGTGRRCGSKPRWRRQTSGDASDARPKTVTVSGAFRKDHRFHPC